MSDDMLLAKRGVPWSYLVTPSPTTAPLSKRLPSTAEEAVIARARSILASQEAKAIALLDGPNLVFVEYKAPATDDSLFNSASMGKTVTSMAVGQAICAGKMKFDDRAMDAIPELKGKALGAATVKDLLRMASGAAEPANPENPHSGNLMTARDMKDWTAGKFNFVEMISRDHIASAERGVFSDYKPGEKFSYKNTDPLTLGLMVNRATGMPISKWVQQTIFDPMGVAGPGFISQDKLQQASSDGGVHLRMNDWIRFAQWVQHESGRNDCFGDYVKQATHTQIANGTSPKTRRTGGSFGGYGYLVWTENGNAPNTYWALGYGGQRIGWNYDNDRMIIAFSNLENWGPVLSSLYVDWIRAAP